MPPTTPELAKYFVWTCCGCILFYAFAILRPTREPNYANVPLNYTILDIPLGPPPPAFPSLAYEDLRYILQWTQSSNSPFKEMGHGRSMFLDKKCEFSNCYITDDRNYFLDMSEFDVVLFHVKDTLGLKMKDLPKKRSPSQKYVFAMMESSHYYPVCDSRWNGFFNWTWTYRLDSDIRLGYLSFYDKLEPQKRLGPVANMDWSILDSQWELPQEDLDKLNSKTEAAAWFVSNCRSKSKREDFAKQLKVELAKYDMKLDIYGACGEHKCPRSVENQCNEMLERKYFFYLSFENSFAEDYVTEKLFTALDHLAVPVVYGGANYTRFLPPNSYLNARELGPRETARRMHQLISSPAEYRSMFHWRHKLEYRLTWYNEDMCALCAAISDPARFEKTSVIKDLRTWWNQNSSGVCPRI